MLHIDRQTDRQTIMELIRTFLQLSIMHLTKGGLILRSSVYQWVLSGSCQTWHCQRMAQKTAKPTLHAADGIWGRPPPSWRKVSRHWSWCSHPLNIWVFVPVITNEFILGLDVLHAYDASVDLEYQMLHLTEEEVSLWGLHLPAW
jgi:hypothetical protein